MSLNSYGATRRNFFSILPLISLLIFSFCASDGRNVLASGYTPTQSEVAPKIDLTPSSESRFFDCGVTASNGTSSLPGLNADESAQSALTDMDLDTIVMGKAAFDVSSNRGSAIVNSPGPDLMVVEMYNPEPINASIYDPEIGSTKSLVLSPTPSNDTNTNNCEYTVNQVFVDLDSFGVPLGSAVPSIRLDTLGTSDTLVGSDIAEIIILEPPTNENLPHTALPWLFSR